MNRGARSSIPSTLLTDLLAALGETKVSHDPLNLAAVAPDASHYLLTPGVLVRAGSTSDVAAAMAAAKRHNVAVNFRSGGTSLSGQGLTNGVMVDTRRSFRGIEVLDGGRKVRVQPGATVVAVNAVLARYGRKLGPDPASSVACTLGGVLADNSSGMSCGTIANSYRTLDSMVFVLASGTVVNTSEPQCEDKLAHDEPELVETLLALRDQCRERARADEIAFQFSRKNTMGYGLNAFLDYDTPAQILSHLMIGSEGTLGFISSAVMNTVQIMPKLATALLHFPTLDSATKALPALVESGVTVTELMDSSSLQLCRDDPANGHIIPPAPGSGDAALLVEYHCPDDQSRKEAIEAGNSVISGLDLVNEPTFTDDPAVRGPIWTLRNGLYAKIAGTRPSGQTALLEDIAVPVETLAGVCGDLQQLFGEHNYPESVIFGHAKDGNIHFLVLEDFREKKGLDRYERFTEDMVTLVLDAHGTLKAEHGTGRIMAPFVERQYGPDLYRIMRQVKESVDPTGVLNRGSIITDDPKLHLKEVKLTPTVQEEVDRCVECGYCEPVCPSRNGPSPRPATTATRSWLQISSSAPPTRWCRPVPSTGCARRTVHCTSTPETWFAACEPNRIQLLGKPPGTWPPRDGIPSSPRRAPECPQSSRSRRPPPMCSPVRHALCWEPTESQRCPTSYLVAGTDAVLDIAAHQEDDRKSSTCRPASTPCSVARYRASRPRNSRSLRCSLRLALA